MPNHTTESETVETERQSALVETVLVVCLLILVSVASVTAFRGGLDDGVSDGPSRVVSTTP